MYGQQIWSIGLEVTGLSQLFGLGLGLLGLNHKMDPDNPSALKEFQQLRNERKSIEREKQRLPEHEAQQASQGGPTNGCFACGPGYVETVNFIISFFFFTLC